jgi:hypothetical protein
MKRAQDANMDRKNAKYDQSAKRRFRASKIWKEFRDRIRKKQVVDPVTGQKLTRLANLHHLDLHEENYENISNEENFVFLNQATHKTIHFFFLKSKPREWRKRLLRLIPYLKKMEKLNEV